MHFDAWKQEYDRGDGRVDIGAFEDYSDLHNAIDAWQRLRDHAGLPDKYFHEAIEGKRKLVSGRCLMLASCHGTCDRQTATSERWLAANYPATGDAAFDGKSFAGLQAALERAQADQLSVRPYPFMTDIVLLPERQRYKAPYVPFVNECKPGKGRRTRTQANIRPKKISYRGKTLTGGPRWAKQVHNATAYGPDANKQFLKIPGVKEPEPGWTSADVSVHSMVRVGEKWKRGRLGTRCTPID